MSCRWVGLQGGDGVASEATEWGRTRQVGMERWGGKGGGGGGAVVRERMERWVETREGLGGGV